MNIQAYAEAKEIAINEIGEKLDVDLSPESLPKSSEPKILELFRLQKIAMSIQPEVGYNEVAEELLAKVKEVKGVGPSLFEKIQKALGK